ncbi:hypothetical protein GOBAR_DD21144 [Gossypium barbadense]|nr:hypothetical protein GOBAR_DD21144 [Gossypium barbadense]
MQSGEILGGESGVARATKKVHRREDDPPDVGDMEVDEGRAKVVSFKDKLLGWVSNDNQEEDFDEDKFELIERDVITGLADGIPNVKFFERVHTWNQKSMAKTVIIKLLGWKIGFNNLISKLNSMWKLNGSFQLMDLKNDYYFIKFQAKKDYDKVLIDCPWTIYGQYLTVQPWASSFNTSARNASSMETFCKSNSVS